MATPSPVPGQNDEAALDFFGTNDGLLVQQEDPRDDPSGSELSDSEPDFPVEGLQVRITYQKYKCGRCIKSMYQVYYLEFCQAFVVQQMGSFVV